MIKASSKSNVMWQEVSPKGKGAADVRRRGGGRLGMQKEQMSIAVSIKKAEHRRIDVYELWYWRRLLRVSWTARKSNQSILKQVSPGCSLEGQVEAETPILWPPDVKN